jgi:hypothetical protein
MFVKYNYGVQFMGDSDKQNANYRGHCFFITFKIHLDASKNSYEHE